MNRKSNKRGDRMQRSKSISANKVEHLTAKKGNGWVLEPDEITGFGNKRLVKAVLIPNTTVHHARDTTDEEELEDIYDWIACLITDSYSAIGEIYKQYSVQHTQWGKLSLRCSEFPNNGFPAGANYKIISREKDRKTGTVSLTEIKCSPPDYIEHAFNYILAQLEDDSVFPDEFSDFPLNFKQCAKEINTMLFRILAILFNLMEPSVFLLATELKAALRHLIYYSFTWNLLDEQEMACIQHVVDPIKQQYEIDYKELAEST